MPMGILQSQVGLVALWAVAGVSTLWILGPLVLFLSPLRRVTTEVFEDPRLADDHGGDADFARRIAELKALGFTPVGKTRERFRFFTPLHWNRVWNGCRWFASPDRRVFVEIHRLAAGHPQRMNANTTFEGGGLLVTATAPTGMGGEIGERYRRVEVGSETVDALVREHERHVNDFSREAGLRVKAATLSEMATESANISKPFIARHRLAGLYAPAIMYLMPLWAVITTIRRVHRLPWLPPALLCGMALLFAVVRLVVLPEYRRVRWLGFAVLMALLLGFPMVLPRVLPRHRSDRRGADTPGEVTPAPATNHP
jgi:hypothetical protein